MRTTGKTIHIVDCATGRCLSHTSYPDTVAKVGAMLGLRVRGVPHWQVKLARMAQRFNPLRVPAAALNQCNFPSPSSPYGERLGIAGAITPAEASRVGEVQARESFNDELYRRVVQSRKYGGTAA